MREADRAVHQLEPHRADLGGAPTPPAEFTHKSELLRGHADKAGTDFDAIVRSTNYNVVIAETQAEIDDRLDALERRLAPHLGDRLKGVMANYRGLHAYGVGTVAQIIHRLTDMRERGLGYAINYFPEAAYDRSGIELFEREVIPALS